ncbi:MAG TPA: DUF4230 domain-containing protein [Bacteroidales bacterium]|nr:DUF4230 domain-containing protein [Bacteroidales bacterium]
MKKTGYQIFTALVVSMLIFSACNSSSKRAEVVNQLKSASKLTTVEYVLTKIVSAKENKLIGKNLYFFAKTKAYVKAGIDLSKLQENDIVISENKISVSLPPIEIINFSYPADSFEVVTKYTEERSLFGWNNIDVEQKDDYFRQAETDIRANINDLGITEVAEKNALKFLTKLLASLGFTEIYLTFKPGDGVLQENKELQQEIGELENVISDLKTALKKSN